MARTRVSASRRTRRARRRWTALTGSPPCRGCQFQACSRRRAADRVAGPERPAYRALAAEHDGHLAGLAEYEVPPEETTAEIALAVADDGHHRGVATLLLEHLADVARTAGVTAFTADALSENHEVLKVFKDLGLHIARRFDGPEVRCTVELTEDETYLRAVDALGRLMDVVSLRPLLRPRSVVVIGTGRKPGSVGRAILRNICTRSFTGRLFAVMRRIQETKRPRTASAGTPEPSRALRAAASLLRPVGP